MRSFEKMVMDFIEILDNMHITYVLIGGIAVSSWGNPRTTKDLDIIVVLKMDDIDKFHKNLEKGGFSFDIKDIKDSINEKTHFTIFDDHSEYHIDAKGIYNKFDALTVRNKHIIRYEGHDMCIASAEDTIAHKLLFGGHQDVKDAESILARQPHINSTYLEELCRNLGVSHELDVIKKKIISEIGNSGNNP